MVGPCTYLFGIGNINITVLLYFLVDDLDFVVTLLDLVIDCDS